MQQAWCGLSTTPCANGASLQSRYRLGDEFHGAARAAKLQGGAGSSRSQFRARAHTVTGAGHNAPLGVRVGVVPRDPPGAALATSVSAAKPAGKNASLCVEAMCAHRAQRIRKRSLFRAIRRAQTQGQATYRGRPLIPSAPALPVVSCAPPKKHAERFEIFSWNCGGLSQLLLSEVKFLLQRHRAIKIMILVETHHSYTNEWTDGDWTFVHSPAASAKQGGILLGIRRDFCHQATLRWQELIPGRLLHLRCFAQNLQHLDVVAIYQHTLPFGTEALDAALKKRKGLWSRLDAFLSSLPVRSSVLLAGDFNSGLNATATFAGFGIVPHSQQASVASERQELTAMLHSHRLCALNTWGRKEPTYKHPSGQSQIDFILVRCALADGQAKRCAVWRTPLAGWRSAGHESLKASLRLHWKPWTLGRSCVKGLRENGGMAGANGAIQLLREKIHQTPAPLVPRVARPMLQGLNGELLKYWQAQRQLRAPSNGTFRDIFARMRLFLQLRKQHRELKAKARLQKRRQILDILERAEGAAAVGDSRSLFQCVRLLAPRGGARSIRLRDDQGSLMHPRAECRMLSQYASELFKARRDQDIYHARLLPLSPELFTPSAWKAALRSLRTGKAVPAGQPAIAAWKQDVDAAALELSRISREALCSESPYVPTEWSDMQFAWLPKVGKSPCTPANLRSIGLMAADTKGLLVILREAVKPPILRYMIAAPQYAYRPGASTADALLRASYHCSSVRALLSRHQQDHTSRMLGLSDVVLVGGMMLSVDLRKAFDSISHTELYLSLLAASVPQDLASVLMQIHVQTSCAVLHGGTSEFSSMSRGLRQGCPVAPILFAAWSVRMLHLLRGELPEGADGNSYTMFADDLHGCWEFRTAADFTSALREIKALIGVLEGLGMEINLQKSLVVLRLRGSAVARVTRHILVWRDDGQYLRLRSEPKDLYIPVSSTMPYLGATLSYENFELQTFQTRAKAAQSRYQELRKVLRSNGALSLRHRLRLYKATAWPALWYALGSVGVTGEVLRGAVSVVAGHLRKVLRIYEHGITNQAVMDRASLCPRTFFTDQVAVKVRRIAEDTGRSAALKQRELRRAMELSDAMTSLSEVSLTTCSLVRVPVSEAVQIPCSVCGLYFGSREGLHMHMSLKHASINKAAQLAFNKARHSLFGLPFCRFCRQRMHDWSSLSKHVSMGMCLRVKAMIAEGMQEAAMFQVLDEEERRNPPVPPSGATAQSDIQAAVKQALTISPSQLGARGAELRILSKHCALCYQLVKDSSKIKTHWQASHAEEWGIVAQLATSEARSLLATFSSPCAFCGSAAKKASDHCVKCSALFQLLAHRCLVRGGWCEPGAQRGPSLKQWQVPVRYQQFRPEKTSIGRFLSFKGPSEPQVDDVRDRSGSTTLLPPPALSSDSYTRIAQQSGAAAAAEASVPLEPDWAGRLVLLTPHNLCYMNAAFLALVHCSDFVLPAHRGVQALRRLGVQALSLSRGMLLTSQLQIRSVLRSWTFDCRQHDVSEFAAVLLLQGLGLGQMVWESRRVEEDALRVLHSGPLPLLLPPPSRGCMLQDCLRAWHEQDSLHGLVARPAPELLLLQVTRQVDGHKNFIPVWPDDEVRVPFFGDGLRVDWISYKVKAVVEHHGERVSTGHYRADLRGSAEWLHTDDGLAAVVTEWDRNRATLSYLFWVVRAQAGEHAAAIAPIVAPSL